MKAQKAAAAQKAPEKEDEVATLHWSQEYSGRNTCLRDFGIDMPALHEHLRGVGMPEDALPAYPATGKYGYTLVASNGATVEVLTRVQAFRMGKVCGRVSLGAGIQAQVSWCKFGGIAEAWKMVKECLKWG
jgi:hypothetical protein